MEWGDIRDKKTVEMAVAGSDTIIHLAACIPPLADKNPDLAAEINITGTRNIIEAAKQQRKPPHIIYSSSIAVYGDRRQNPCIRIDDPVSPNDDDYYAKQKVFSEILLKESGVPWTILRLTYITDVERLKLDPLMFSMPLETHLEICDVEDAARAIANAADTDENRAKMMNIGGGVRCRTTFGEYLSEMFRLFGLGRQLFNRPAFSTKKFHCGLIDSEISEKVLSYQHISLSDFYEKVKKKYRVQSVFFFMLRPLIRMILLFSSPYFQGWINNAFRSFQRDVRHWFLYNFLRVKQPNPPK
jgi:nucleoside-diphosphate-sugar epimerase